MDPSKSDKSHGTEEVLVLEQVDLAAAQGAGVTKPAELARFAERMQVLSLSSTDHKTAPIPVEFINEAEIDPQFQGPVLVYLNYDQSEADSCELLARASELPNDIKVLAAEPKDTRFTPLDSAIARREYSAIIHVNPENKPSALDHYLGLNHVPHIARLRDTEGLLEVLNLLRSWNEYQNRYEELLPPEHENLIAKWHEEKAEGTTPPSLIDGRNAQEQNSPAQLEHKIFEGIADRIKRKHIDVSKDPTDNWGAKTGFASEYSADDLRELASHSGVHVSAIHADGLVLGYYIFFTDAENLPTRGQAIVDALVQGGAPIDPSKAGYSKIMEVTPAGQKFGRIHGVDMHTVLDLQMEREAGDAGVTHMVAESRAFPFPNRIAIKAHEAKGWIDSQISILHHTGAPLESEATSLASLLYRPLKGEARPSPSQHVEAASAHNDTAGFNLSMFEAEHDQSITLEDCYQHLDSLSDPSEPQVYTIGPRDTAREFVHIHKMPDDSLLVFHRTWDAEFNTVVNDNRYELRLDTDTPPFNMYKLKSLVTLLKRSGELAR